MLMTDQIFLGHLGTVSLAAAALGTTYSNIMWWVVLWAPFFAWEPVHRFLACDLILMQVALTHDAS